MISDFDLEQARQNLHRLDPENKARVLALMEERDRMARLQNARDHFIPFVEEMWPGVILGAHHTLMAEAFERVVKGDCKRLIINMAPRHSKSEMASWLLPSWYLGKFPKHKIIQASATENLAAGFGRKVRNLVGGENSEDLEAGEITFADVFPDVTLAKDSKAASGWHTNRGGEYFAIGTSGVVTGKGGNIIVLDDIVSEQQAKQAESNPDIYDSSYEWYKTGPRQRLQPGGSLIIVQTRWSKKDLTGRLIDAMAKRGEGEYGDNWEVLELPAILDENTANERPMWPGFWSIEELRNTRAEIGPAKFRAQYQQQPTSEEGAIIKKDYWRQWGSENETCPGPDHTSAWGNHEPPACSYIILSIDTALKKNQRADYSAFTVWGVFAAEDSTSGKTFNNLILLNAFKDRLEFPELKRRVKRAYEDDQPDIILIEDKGSGISLIQELRSMGVPVEAYNYGRGAKGAPNDKVARTNMVADIFASGYVWAPQRRFADEVAIECAEFPNGDNDDYVDSVVQAMLRFRNGGFIRTANDQDDDDEEQTGYVRKRMY